MRTEGSPHSDRSTSVVPPIICNQPDDVAAVRAMGGFRIEVRFHDGTSGIVDLSRLIQSEEAGVFAELRDPAVFSSADVSFGAVTWPGGIDLAPDAMYLALKATGEWILA